MKQYQLMIFDWDGTLMDSEAHIVACIQEACRDMGLEVPSAERARNVIGLGLHEACRQVLPEHGEAVHLKMSERYRHHFFHGDATPSQLFEGVEVMLQDLDSQGHFLAIATGKGRAGLDAVLQETGLGRYFHATRCADETASKPNPQMLHELLEYFALEPQQAIMIGDTEYDLEMAGHARMASLAVSYGVHETERLLKHQPLACVDSIPQMHQWLRGNAS